MTNPASISQTLNINMEVIKGYIVFTITTVIVFAAAYYGLMEQSIKYTEALNNYQTQQQDKPTLQSPAKWLYIGTSEALIQSKEQHDVLSALYYSLCIQSNLGSPHYPPNTALKLLSVIHIVLILAASIFTIA